MTPQSARWNRPSALVLALWTMSWTGCVAEHDVLGSPDAGGLGGLAGSGGAGPNGGDGGTGGSAATGGTGAGAAFGWTEIACYEALARGKEGDPCTGNFGCHLDRVSCCQLAVACADGILRFEEDCSNCTFCRDDPECPPGQWCVGGQCSACQAPEPCPPTWEPVDRNGCPWCVPPSECDAMAGCPDRSMVCYPGQACLPGCSGDPSCCYGNVCAPAGCGPTADLDCTHVGCPLPTSCLIGNPDDPRACKCDPDSGQWLCTTAQPNFCAPP